MYKGEEREFGDKVILQDLLSAGYVEEVKTSKAKKDVESSESE